MAANNLRITYQNMVDFPATAVVASSAATAATAIANLKNDTRSLIWRSSSNVLTNYPVIFKDALNAATAGPHTSITVSALSSSGTPATWFATVTGNGDTERALALQLPSTFTFANTAAKTSYTLRTYSTSTVTASPLDTQIIPVVFKNAGGSDTITVVLSNERHRLPSGAAGASPNFTDSGTNIFVFEGTTPLKYDAVGTAQGTWRINSTAPTGDIVVGAFSIGASGSYATVANHSTGVTPAATDATIQYNITGVRRGTGAVSTSKTQTLPKSNVANTDPRYTTSTVVNAASANLVVTFPTTPLKIGLIALTLTNLSSTATIRVRGFTGTAATLSGGTDAPTVSITGATTVFDTLPLAAAPFTSSALDSWSDNTFGTLTYGLNKNTGRVYVPVLSQVACTSVLLEIFDFANTDKYVEASRLIIGPYWSPAYNTSFGLSTQVNDTSSKQRSEAGDLVTTFGVVYNSMSFNMDWLTSADRIEMEKILRINGMRKPLFISLFPENTTDYAKEADHQIYGKLSSTAAISHPYPDLYSTQVEIEEI